MLLVAGCSACGDKLIVPAPIPASIEITPDTSVALNLGDHRQLTVVVRDARGNVIGSVGLLGYDDTPLLLHCRAVERHRGTAAAEADTI